MEKNVAIILSLTVAAISVVFLATSGMLPTTFAVAQIPTQQSTDSKVLGHVTYVVRGPDGQIKSYMQTDNIRTTQGLNCAANYLFNNKTTSGSCPALTGTSGFNWIYLVNNTFSTNSGDTWSTFHTGATGCTAPCIMTTTNQGAPSAAGTVSFPSTGQAQIVSPTYTFTTAGSGMTITGSALFNKQGSGNEFAENTMNVAVGSADTLTVTWTITLS